MLEFEIDATHPYAFASDSNNFYLATTHKIFKISNSVEDLTSVFFDKEKQRFVGFFFGKSFLVNIEKNLLVCRGKVFDNGEIRDRVADDDEPFVYEPHLYRNAYRSRNYFVSKLPLRNKEPKLLLPSSVLKEYVGVGNGILVYNMETREHKALDLKGNCAFVAVTLDGNLIGVTYRHSGKLLVRIYDNDV